MHDALAVKCNLRRRGIDVDSQCSYCGYEEENSQHIFRTCSVARLVWTIYQPQVQIDDNDPMSAVAWVQKHIRLFYSKDEVGIRKLEEFVAMLWSLWVTRNERVFRNKGGHARSVLFQAEEAMKSLQNFKQNPQLPDEKKDPDIPPGFNFVNLGENTHIFTNFVLQVDGSWDKKTKRAGWGWAYKQGNDNNNNNNHYRDGGGEYGYTSTALHAETKACLHGLQWVKEQEIRNGCNEFGYKPKRKKGDNNWHFLDSARNKRSS
ncbi:uncharacterized protein [Spinacia oleracea]|uniref:Reverse transcriptase zinc-binding domain-containing protein n=1 Tax=Spinacia oleracea TaxID=3562 RepID=A0A9R0KAR0_SPIOL|nr:uncharacterized protein LOC110802520 [Spinacia oleracea]